MIGAHSKKVAIECLIFAIPLHIECYAAFYKVDIMTVDIMINSFFGKRNIRKATF